jgi:hypothetical protein
VLTIAHRQAIASGAANTAEIAAETLSAGISISEEQIREILQVFPDVQFLEDHWFWYPKGRRGWNQHIFSVYLTYSAVIAHVSIDIWTLRGLQVNPGVVEALRAANAEQSREKRVLDYSWTPEGHLWVGVRLPDLKSRTSFIFLMPSAIRHLVADSEFSAFSESSLPSGRIRVTEDGQSWGYGPFLARSGAEEAIFSLSLISRSILLFCSSGTRKFWKSSVLDARRRFNPCKGLSSWPTQVFRCSEVNRFPPSAGSPLRLTSSH